MHIAYVIILYDLYFILKQLNQNLKVILFLNYKSNNRWTAETREYLFSIDVSNQRINGSQS